jgi:hypothetical protein
VEGGGLGCSCVVCTAPVTEWILFTLEATQTEARLSEYNHPGSSDGGIHLQLTIWEQHAHGEHYLEQQS